MKTCNLRALGTLYEQIAADYLRENGYDILAQNYRIRQGEIDVIAKTEATLVFVEVKYRTTEACGRPREAVGRKKQRTICRVALHYLLSHRLWENTPCRFDVIEVDSKGTITHLQHAFDYIEG